MEKYRVTLTPEERAELEHLVSVGKAAARKLTHARILLLADTAAGEEHVDDEIVAALGVGICTIGRVRKRLVTEGLPRALNPRPRPSRPEPGGAGAAAGGAVAACLQERLGGLLPAAQEPAGDRPGHRGDGP